MMDMELGIVEYVYKSDSTAKKHLYMQLADLLPASGNGNSEVNLRGCVYRIA